MIRTVNIESGAVTKVKLGGDTGARTGYVYETFLSDVVAVARLGAGAATGTTGDRNIMATGKNLFEYHIKGTQTIVAPVLTAVGLDIGLDQTNADGLEITSGILARGPSAFTIGSSSAFSLRVKVKVEDASGFNPMCIGFRKQEAYQATLTSYADYAYIGIVGTSDPNLIKIQTETAGGGTTTTDTTQTWADAATKTLKVSVSAAGVVTYTIDGSAPTVTAAYTFTAALGVCPSLYYLHAADVGGKLELIEWECGLDDLTVT